MNVIAIRKWDDTFENADTRKRVRLGWFLHPSGSDSKGYRQLMRHGSRGVAAFGLFNALLQTMATMPKPRGTFTNSDGTGMELADVWEMTRIPPADGESLLPLLVEIGWVECKSATSLPLPCHLPPGFVKGEGEGEEKGEGEGPAPTPDEIAQSELDEIKPFKCRSRKTPDGSTRADRRKTIAAHAQSEFPELCENRPEFIARAIKNFHDCFDGGWEDASFPTWQGRFRRWVRDDLEKEGAKK